MKSWVENSRQKGKKCLIKENFVGESDEYTDLQCQFQSISYPFFGDCC